MSKWIKELCFFVLLTSNILVSSKPYHRSKRVIVKDYLNPFTYPTANVQFQKDDDGKYHALHLMDSKVEYALVKNLEDLNTIAKDVTKPTENEEKDLGKDDGQDVVLDRNYKTYSDITVKPDVEHSAEDVSKVTSELFTKTLTDAFGSEGQHSDPKLKEIEKKAEEKGKRKFTLVKQQDHNMQFSPKPDSKDDQHFDMKPLDEYLPQPPLPPNNKKIEMDKAEGVSKMDVGQIPSLNGEERPDKKIKEKGKRKYTLVKQDDHNMQFLPKPNGKDDQHFAMTPLDEYLPQPRSKEHKKNKEEGKLAIGQIPFLGSLPFFANPVFLPERSFSMGVVSRMPLPPALDVQDRLPMLEDADVTEDPPKPALDIQDRLPMMLDEAEVLDEASETAVVENVDPKTGLVKSQKTTMVHRFRNPFGTDFGFSLDALKSMKDDMDGQELNHKSEAKIVDVMGKKMLLQNKVMKYPTDSSRSMYIGVMSVRPLSEVDPETLKKLGVENEARGTDKTNRELEDKVQEKKIIKETIPSLDADKVTKDFSEELEKVDIDKDSKADILKAEESKLDEKFELSDAAVAEAIVKMSSTKEIIPDNENKEDDSKGESLEPDGMSSEPKAKESKNSNVENTGKSDQVSDTNENINSLKQSLEEREKPMKDIDLPKKEVPLVESKKKIDERRKEDKMKTKKSKKNKYDDSEEIDSDSDDDDE